MIAAKQAIGLIAAWGTAIGGLGVLVAVMRPVSIPPAAPFAEAAPAHRGAPVAAPVSVPAPEPEPTLELATVNIVGVRAQHARHVEAPRDTPAPLKCAPWRELVQGGVVQRVRTCD